MLRKNQKSSLPQMGHVRLEQQYSIQWEDRENKCWFQASGKW